MPRNISYMLTTQQIKDRTKTVTRRLRWLSLKVGDKLQGCAKCQGLKPGEKLQRLALQEVIAVRRERLDCMLQEPYGSAEAALEGFPGMTGAEFVAMFCKHMGCSADTEITRIEFKYL